MDPSGEKDEDGEWVLVKAEEEEEDGGGERRPPVDGSGDTGGEKVIGDDDGVINEEKEEDQEGKPEGAAETEAEKKGGGEEEEEEEKAEGKDAEEPETNEGRRGEEKDDALPSWFSGGEMTAEYLQFQEVLLSSLMVEKARVERSAVERAGNTFRCSLCTATVPPIDEVRNLECVHVFCPPCSEVDSFKYCPMDGCMGLWSPVIIRDMISSSATAAENSETMKKRKTDR